MDDAKLVAEQYMLSAINTLIQGISWKMVSLKDMEKVLDCFTHESTWKVLPI